jgi:putative ABC transport system permease protein
MKAMRAFRWLLRLLPFDFRADYGREMEQVFRQQHAEARAERGGAARVWARTVRDFLRLAPAAHLADLRQDVSLAVRSMRRRVAFSLVAVATLALGIGANTALFSLLHAVLLAPLPYAEPDRLVYVWNRVTAKPRLALSDPELLDYAERARSLRIGGQAGGSVNLGGDGDPERLPAAYVSVGLLDILGAPLLFGRAFTPEEEAGRTCAILLTEGLWRRRYGADANVVGRSVSLNGGPCAVAGVLPHHLLMPTDFAGGERAQIVMPLGLDPAASRHRRGGHYLHAVGRLAPGLGMEAAQAEMDGILADLARAYPDEHDQGGFGISLVPLRTQLLGEARPVLMVLWAAVLLVLLLACANVANLLLARGEARRRELAVRSALGANRFRLVRQLLTETCVLALAGATAGLLLARWSLRAVVALDPFTLPRAAEASLSLPVLAFTVALALAAGIGAGLLPALQSSASDPGRSLLASRGDIGGGSVLRRALVAVQVALAVVLLTGAGLLVKSFSRLQAVALGLDPERVLTLRVTAPESRYPDRAAVTSFYARLLDRVRALPGVETVGASSGLPLAVQTGDWNFAVEGRPQQGTNGDGAADWFVVTPGYFEALRIRAVRGRRPGPEDGEAAPPVVFLNEAAARAFFADQDPLGQRLRLTRTTGREQPWRLVAGVVADVRQRGLDRAPTPEMYIPHPQFVHFLADHEARAMSLVLKTAGDPAALAGSVREQLRAIDPDVPASAIRTMDEVLGRSLAHRRRNVWLMGSFAALGLALATVGLYGVMSYHVAQRTRELGVRLALGAARGDLLRLVVGQGLRLVQIGLAAGLALALMAGRALRGLLYEVGPRDVGVLLTIALVLASTGLLASYLPARRATSVDAAAALKQD